MSRILAWTPFLEPLNAHRVWFLLLLPLAFLVALAYKAVRVPDMRGYWRQVILMTIQIVAGMVFLGLGFYLFTQWVLPWILPMPGT